MMPHLYDQIGSSRNLSKAEATIQIGALSISLKILAADAELIHDISSLYADYPQNDPDELADFEFSLIYPGLWDHYFSRNIQIVINGVRPFQPMPAYLGVPLLESALNWCIGNQITRYLLIHAGVDSNVFSRLAIRCRR